MKPSARIGIIGGSGLYRMKAFEADKELRLNTPFGKPSAPLRLGRIKGAPCAFLPRHGLGHTLLPGEINNRANIYALKSVGVERVIAVGAVGSLREELAPRHFVFPDQLVDETKSRVSTFFGGGIVGHAALAHPFCGLLSDFLHEKSRDLGVVSHKGGTYICMEGPAFSTKAESAYHRRLGYSIIGMTAAPEAKLAREAELCYAGVCLVTDYDCWKEDEEVSGAAVVEHLMANVANAQRLLEAVVPALDSQPRSCRCQAALSGAIFTAPGSISPKTARKLDFLVGKYLKK